MTKPCCIVVVGCTLLTLGCEGSGETTTATTLAQSPEAAVPALARTHPIVFWSRGAEDEIGDLFLLDPDSGELQRVTPDSGDFRFPRWSPDGTRIVFRDVSGGTSADLTLINPDGTGFVAITRDEPAVDGARSPSWSADGERIAFASLRSPSEPPLHRLWTITPIGSEPEPLLPEVPNLQLDVGWSPAAPSMIAYGRGDRDAAVDLWVTDTEQGDEGENLTQGAVYGIGSPTWSPDGTKIAFSAYAIGADGMIEGLGDHSQTGGGGPDNELFVVDVTTRELVRLTDNIFADDMPCWSPDGESLVFASDRDGDSDLWLMPLAAPEEAQNLIDDAAEPREDSMPDWFLGPR